MLLIGVAAQKIYYNRCEFITCQAASWAEVKQLIKEQQFIHNTQLGLSETRNISIRFYIPSYSLDDLDQVPIEYNVEYFSIDAAQAVSDNEYPFKEIRFDDRYLKIKQRLSTSQWLLSPAEAEKTNQLFDRMQIDPRDTYRKTLPLAKNLLGDIKAIYYFSILLDLRDQSKPMWAISYDGEADNDIIFRVNAETGEIVYHRLRYYDPETGEWVEERYDYPPTEDE